MTAVLCHTTLFLHQQCLHPYLETLQFTPARASVGDTYPRLECDAVDLTRNNPADLFANVTYASSVASSFNALASSVSKHHELYMAQQVIEKALLHGATILPEILTRDVAHTLRHYIVTKRNLHLPSLLSVLFLSLVPLSSVFVPLSSLSFLLVSRQFPSLPSFL
jgi:hypothetical protein